jgi:hypothetical protein
MVKLTGPCHSDQASGTLAGQLTYRQTKRGAIAQAYSQPGTVNKRTPSDKQIAIRERTKTLMQTWKNLPAAQQATWATLAAARNLAPVNVYLQENYKRQNAGLDPTNVWPPNDEPPAAVKIYSGGTITPDLTSWQATFAAAGALTLLGNEVWASGDLQTVEIDDPQTYDGQLEFSNLPDLTYFNHNGPNAGPPVILHNLPALTEIWIFSQSQTTLPDMADLPSLANFHMLDTALTTALPLAEFTTLRYIEITGNAITDTDALILAIVATFDIQTEGYLTIYGGTNAAPTAASASALAALMEAWNVVTN